MGNRVHENTFRANFWNKNITVTIQTKPRKSNIRINGIQLLGFVSAVKWFKQINHEKLFLFVLMQGLVIKLKDMENVPFCVKIGLKYPSLIEMAQSY
jgi:hypothetical protein